MGRDCEINRYGQQYMSQVLNTSWLILGQGVQPDGKLQGVKTGTFTGAEAAKEGANKK